MRRYPGERSNRGEGGGERERDREWVVLLTITKCERESGISWEKKSKNYAEAQRRRERTLTPVSRRPVLGARPAWARRIRQGILRILLGAAPAGSLCGPRGPRLQ